MSGCCDWGWCRLQGSLTPCARTGGFCAGRPGSPGSGQARPDQAGLIGDHDQLGPVSRAKLGHHRQHGGVDRPGRTAPCDAGDQRPGDARREQGIAAGDHPDGADEVLRLPRVPVNRSRRERSGQSYLRRSILPGAETARAWRVSAARPLIARRSGWCPVRPWSLGGGADEGHTGGSRAAPGQSLAGLAARDGRTCAG
jgi:hypothetical protein